ncbi:MAG: hypothetical protein H0X65_21100 [Gemmatimonadetes bacterium]|nr:hypothetical protein [Gemmatimonadota bacterium]
MSELYYECVPRFVAETRRNRNEEGTREAAWCPGGLRADPSQSLEPSVAPALPSTTAAAFVAAEPFPPRSVPDAAHFAVWAVDQVDVFREVAARETRHGRLLDMMTHVEANHVYLIFAYHTADAAGQNMVTFCTAAVCRDILERTPVQPAFWFLESNMSGDKKATAMSFLQTRGRNVTAEVRLPRELVTRGLRTTPERMVDYWRMSFVAGVQTGSIGVSGHIAIGSSGRSSWRGR